MIAKIRSLNLFKSFCTPKDHSLIRYSHFTELESKQLIREQNPLRDLIMRHIDEFGEMRIQKYWNMALTDPQYGYYSNDNVFSKSGDFTTSPQISVLFGEMIAVWMRYFLEKTRLIDEQTQQLQKEFRIIELGGGRGQLMKDIITSFKDMGIANNFHIEFVEASAYNRKAQQDNVIEAFRKQDQFFKFEYQLSNDKVQYFTNQEAQKSLSLKWFNTLEELYNSDIQKQKEGKEVPFTIFVMNEFMDALPISILKLTENGWRQKVLTRSSHHELYFELGISSSPCPEKMSPGASQSQQIGEEIEISHMSLITMDLMAKMIMKYGGCIINVDYGDNGVFEDSVRAIKDHKYVPSPYFWQIPGKCDLSAYVNFNALAQYAERNEGVIAHEAVPQGYFLQAMGIVPRVDLLKEKADKETQSRIESEYDRLVHPDQMGKIYKVQIITKKEYGEIYPFIEIDENTF